MTSCKNYTTQLLVVGQNEGHKSEKIYIKIFTKNRKNVLRKTEWMHIIVVVT